MLYLKGKSEKNIFLFLREKEKEKEMANKRMPPDYLLRPEDDGYVFVVWDGEEYEQPFDAGWSTEKEDIVRLSWGHYYADQQEAWNQVHSDSEKILGYRILGENVFYHAECVGSELLPGDFEKVNVFTHELDTVLCEGCELALLSDIVFDEYCQHSDGCSCELCEAVSVIAAFQPDKSAAYLDGYRKGFLGTVEDKIPSLTRENYAEMLGYTNQEKNDFLDGYQAARDVCA